MTVLPNVTIGVQRMLVSIQIDERMDVRPLS